MADDTGTDWAATADRLDGMSRNGYDPAAHSVQREAAVGLRRLAQLDTAIGDQDVDLCAICGEVYCSGAYCLQQMVADLPDDHQECGEQIERVQDLVRLGRILTEWRAAAVLGSGEQPERTEP